MFYSQIVLTRGLPLNLHLAPTKPTIIDNMNRTELDIELTKGIESIHSSKSYKANEVDEMLKEKFGI